ncbi:MAG TPA: CotH kinase family protein [Verrucomicrobiae bacterium]|nr:CotH kinase family protein [Verrucomicrobiae bacterium]
MAVVLAFSARSETIFSTNSTWKYFKGFSEASSPDTTTWRNIGFNDSAWLTGQAPFYYENDPGSSTAYTGNTDLTDMDGGYTCIFMRQTFVLTNLSQINELQLKALSDDGFIAWINGVEVARFNMPSGNVPYNGSSSPALAEPVPLQNDVLSNPQNYLVTGTNVIAIQAFNSSLSASSDFLIWATLSTSATVTWGNVGISEFMATNRNTVADEDGDASPWIEIYNPTTSDANLNGWALTDDTNNLVLWKFPNVTIPSAEDANGSDNFMVVFASGKNRTSNTNELHTNFRLPVNGGYLALVNPSGNVVSVFNYPTQQVDVAYGRDMVNPDIIGYFPKPTPGDYNSSSGTNFSSAVNFSQSGGTFVNSFNLQLSATNANAVIYYTLDGSAPTEDSSVYSGAIPITGSVQVRARAFDDANGLMPGPLHSESYIQLDSGLLNTTSDLPAIVIYNFGAGSVPQDDDQFANISIYEPQNGVTSLTNASTLTARAEIHVHGSSSADIPKQAFSVGFTDDLDADKNYSPLALPSESSFILYAPDNFEPVLIHNPLIYELSNEIGRYAPRTKFCEVYLNTTGGKVTAANYNGIYVIEEKIKWDNNRVNITKIHSVDNLNPQDNSQPNVTGGYMMKIDRLGDGETGFSSAGQTIVYDYPKEPEIKTLQRAPQQQYLQSYMDAFGTALNGANYTDPTNGYRAFIDQPSWIDHHILNVMAFNVDALRLSAYFYKDRTNKLVFGPIWDFDRSQGSTDGRDFSPFYWRSPVPDYGTDYFNYTWWGRMFADIDFWQAWIDRYENLRETLLSTNHIYADIDALVAQVQKEQPREAARWPQYTAPRSGTVSVSGYSYAFPGTYQGEVNFLKQWYADRLHFMDTNFLAKPVLNGNGVITPGFTLNLTGPSGATIYYTTNGVDPRASGGGIAVGAQIYTTPISLATNVTVLARAYNASHRNLTGANNPPLSSPWSGLASEDFVMASAPIITQSPADLEAYIGQSPVFTVQASGVPAPTYQWQLNGTNLVGETNTLLTLSNLQTNQAGTYSVIASNLVDTASASFVLTITPKPNLVITEVMSSEAKKGTGVTISTSDWWELSNLGNFPVNLQGWRFDDDHDSFSDAETITDAVSIAPGESIVLVEDMTPTDFRTWWGSQNLPANLQIITYPNIGFSSDGDAIYLWNAAANSTTDTVTSVTFGTATKGVSFGFDPSSGTFGGLSVAGQNGAFVAPVNGDVGSPGTILNLPRFTELNFDGNSFNLSFVTEPNLNYTVEFKNDLADPVWQTLTNFTAASSLSVISDSTAVTNATRFYRVVVTPHD